MLTNPAIYVAISTLIIVLLCAYLFSMEFKEIFKYLIISALCSITAVFFYDYTISKFCTCGNTMYQNNTQYQPQYSQQYSPQYPQQYSQYPGY